MITLVNGDITLSDCDAIVNAANETLLGGGGIDGAIHAKAGNSVLLECATISAVNGVRCRTGEAKITKAGNLKSKFIIHTVGPIYDTLQDQSRLLSSCYSTSIELAIKYGCNSIAFPEISTGVYSYPKKEARAVARETCEKYADKIEIHLYSY